MEFIIDTVNLEDIKEAVEYKACMAARMKSIGYEVVTDRGDYKVWM